MWNFLKKLWRWFSELDTTVTVFGWIKAGIGMMSGAIVAVIAWLQSQPISIIIVLGLSTLLIALWIIKAVVWLWDRRSSKRAANKASASSVDDRLWTVMAEKNPADTLVILYAGIERSRLQGNHPAWEIFFTAYNGGVGDVRLVSAGGSFKVGGQAYPTPADLKSATLAKHGEITVFTVRQWIDQQDAQQIQQDKNHIVLQLSDLRIEAISTDPMSKTERPFIVPLPDHLQFDVQRNWNINPDFFSWFYRERFGTDDNRTAQTAFSGPHSTRDRSTEAEAAEEPEFIDLKEAASSAFDRLRDASGAENSIALAITMRLGKIEQSKISRRVCEELFNGTKIPLLGIYPPSKVLREIPREHAESFMFSDDASELFNQNNPSERYHSVAVNKSDFEQRLKELT